MNRRATEAELGILTVLWERGPSTVREVYERLEGPGDGAPSRRYTTVLKLLQNMTQKGLVVRDERERAHVYEAAVERDSALKRLIEELAEKAFGGSTLSLALQALSVRGAKPKELEAIRRMLRDSGEEPE